MTAPSKPRIKPSHEEIALARTSAKVLQTALKADAEAQQIDVRDSEGVAHSVSIPTSALRLLIDVLTDIGQGNAVSIISVYEELTTQEAADMLNVSRPYLVQLLEKGEIPFHKIGTHRRVRYQDVLDYQHRSDAQRRKALEDLGAQAQDLGMGY